MRKFVLDHGMLTYYRNEQQRGVVVSINHCDKSANEDEYELVIHGDRELLIR